MFLQSDSINTRDWTQIKNITPTAAISGVTGNLGTLLQTVSTGSTEIVEPNTSAWECKSRAKDIINITFLLVNTKKIYEKDCFKYQCITKTDIVRFKNSFTTHPIFGDVQEYNFIKFFMDKKTFTIYKDAITFYMLYH